MIAATSDPPGSTFGIVMTYVAGTASMAAATARAAAAVVRIERRRVHGHDHDRGDELEAEVGGQHRAVGEVGPVRGVEARRADDVHRRRILAHRDHPPRVDLVAREMEVGELGDGMPQGIVERALGLFPAMQVDDRHAGRRWPPAPPPRSRADPRR